MKFNWKTGLVGLAVVGSALTATACSVGSTQTTPPAAQQASQKEANAQGQDSNNLVNNQGVPVYQFSQERQTLINVEDIQANGENTTTFFFNMGSNTPLGSCASIGMPVASTTELTNPDQQVQQPNGGGYQLNPGDNVLSQMDPTGVYSGDSTGTNVECTGPNGPYIVYWEGFTYSVSGSAVYRNGQIVLLGKPDSLKSGK